MVSAITRASRHYRHTHPEQAPARRVTYVTSDANDARRGHPLPPPFWNKWGLPAPRPTEALPREHPLFASPASLPHEAGERSCHVFLSLRAREERRS